MSDAELAQIQRDIDDQLESYPRAVAQICDSGFRCCRTKKIRNQITTDETRLMTLLESKWALQAKQR